MVVHDLCKENMHSYLFLLKEYNESTHTRLHVNRDYNHIFANNYYLMNNSSFKN